jgi:phenylacetyl-CoA:acceptor oxidoreductase subunit 2
MSVGGNPWLQTHWDWHVALNFLTGGAGSGLLIVAVLTGMPLTVPVLLGAALIGIGLAQVSLHLGRPLRSFNVIFNPQTSWMTREAFVAGPLLLLAVIAGAFDTLVAGLPAALCAAAFIYCQARILKESKGIPVWREPQVVGLIITTGLAEGAALALLVALAAGQPEALLPAGSLLLILVVARFISWRVYRRALAGNAPHEALAVLDRAEGPFVGLGLAVPLLLLGVAATVPAAREILVALGALSAVLTGWGLKFVLITRASYNQGFAIVHTPKRGAGSGGIGSKPGW